jgi:hypothetical protein
MMPSLAAYVRHAEAYGGLRDCWDAAADELDPIELGKLAEALRELGARQRRVGRKGKTATIERFYLTHAETVVLIELLIDVGVDDTDIRRHAGASQSMVGAIRSDQGSDSHISPNLEPAPQGIIRNEVENPTCPTSPPAEALRSPDSQRHRRHPHQLCAYAGRVDPQLQAQGGKAQRASCLADRA